MMSLPSGELLNGCSIKGEVNNGINLDNNDKLSVPQLVLAGYQSWNVEDSCGWVTSAEAVRSREIS